MAKKWSKSTNNEAKGKNRSCGKDERKNLRDR